MAAFIIFGVGLTALAWRLFGAPVMWPVGVISGILTVWCIWFFRDPRRAIPADPGAVISPADGVVCLVDNAPPPPELGMGDQPLQRVCVFMNVFNVHVNRAPLAGVVEKIAYTPGKFLNASLDKASIHNERNGLVIRTPDGRRIGAVQIAGLVARRIVCRIAEGVTLEKGDRFGLIRFGSRVDVYLPAGSAVRAKVGEKTKAGETILATL